MDCWADLVIMEDSKTSLTDNHGFMADTISFQFCEDFEGQIVDVGEAHTLQSTLMALLEDRPIGQWCHATLPGNIEGDTSIQHKDPCGGRKFH